MKISKLGPKCQYFVWPPLFSSTALTLLGMEFTRASQVATGVLFHSSMTTSRSWWVLETLRSSTFQFENAPQITFTLSFFSKAVSDGRGSCSASVCHRMFFGRPWRGLFLVEPVLLNRCLDHRAAVSGFWQSSYSLRHLYVEQQLFFFRSSESS